MDEEILSYNKWVARNRYLDYICKRHGYCVEIIKMKSSKSDLNRETIKAQLKFLRDIKSSQLQQENVKVDGIVTKTPIARGCHQVVLSD